MILNDESYLRLYSITVLCYSINTGQCYFECTLLPKMKGQKTFRKNFKTIQFIIMNIIYHTIIIGISYYYDIMYKILKNLLVIKIL